MSGTSSNKYTVKGRKLDLNIVTSNDINIEPMVNTVYKGDLDISIKHLCPHCGKSHYMELYSSSTAVYYPPIYKDGVNINPDKNTTTTYCRCMECGKEFSFQR